MPFSSPSLFVLEQNFFVHDAIINHAKKINKRKKLFSVVCIHFFSDYNRHMQNGIKIFSRDPIWNRILSDLGIDARGVGIDFGSPAKLTLAEIDGRLRHLAEGRVAKLGIGGLSERDRSIALALPASPNEIEALLGYAHAHSAHGVAAAIHRIRKQTGRRLKFERGIYAL
jgi:hypothetical protein